MRQLEVYVNEVKAGLLTELNPGKGYTFAYNTEYVASDFPPVSLSLPKRNEPYEAENLFPFFTNLLPDGTKAEMEDFAALIGRNEQSDGTYFKYSGCYEDIARCIRKYIPAWMVDMERFFELVVFNYIYANGDNHLKNFSVIRQGGDYRLAPAYESLNVTLRRMSPLCPCVVTS